MEYLNHFEEESIKVLANDIAREFMKDRITGQRQVIKMFHLRTGTISCSVRMSKEGHVWFNATMPAMRHNCVTSKPSAPSGVLIGSRFDATDFVEWIIEELRETLIRAEIVKRIEATAKNNLLSIIMNKQNMSVVDPAECLGASRIT